MKTSIIITTKNSVKTIEQCLASIMPYYEQGYIGEIIVVDGQSIDGTLDVLKKYPVEILFDPGKGTYIACQIGWLKSTCELVMFLDSDAYLGKNIFPNIEIFFNNSSLGIVGCVPKGAGSNQCEKTIGQWWDYHTKNLVVFSKRTEYLKYGKLYNNVVSFNDSSALISGPCFIVRRECLQKVNGFAENIHLYEKYQCLLYPGDIYLCKSIIKSGWKGQWWTEAQVYHYPPENLLKLIKQRYGWGKGDGMLLRQSQEVSINKMLPLIARMGSPVLGLILAIRYKNPFQIITFPVAHYAWIMGYLKILCRRKA